MTDAHVYLPLYCVPPLYRLRLPHMLPWCVHKLLPALFRDANMTVEVDIDGAGDVRICALRRFSMLFAPAEDVP